MGRSLARNAVQTSESRPARDREIMDGWMRRYLFSPMFDGALDGCNLHTYCTYLPKSGTRGTTERLEGVSHTKQFMHLDVCLFR